MQPLDPSYANQKRTEAQTKEFRNTLRSGYGIKPMRPTNELPEELMTPEIVRKTIDSHVALSKALRALYLELDASIVESVEVYVANALLSERAEATSEAVKQKQLRINKLVKLSKKADKRLQQYKNLPPSSGSLKWIEVINTFDELLDEIDTLSNSTEEKNAS